jgi:hypothetical protein
MTFICLNIEFRTQPLIILVVIAGTDKERPGCSKIPLQQLRLRFQISTCKQAYSLRAVWPAAEVGEYI